VEETGLESSKSQDIIREVKQTGGGNLGGCHRRKTEEGDSKKVKRRIPCAGKIDAHFFDRRIGRKAVVVWDGRNRVSLATKNSKKKWGGVNERG